ncbi:butyrophilin subfamily 1 member A1-like isoform X2 [Lathamus discolor]|uniref:butyrophilin subfamily 1 member A1-like isoform X2 n=1 Tax=Lathamus discolor TaxID=678569 RepID=UPI0032B85808
MQCSNPFSDSKTLSRANLEGHNRVLLSLGGGDAEGAMSFLLKPRQCTWDLAPDYHTAKQFEVDVTLDPATAGPEVILSEDLKEASWGRPGLRWPDAPGRFDTDPCLLGREGFTSGRHYWELEATGRFWAVGVALESVQRKGRVLFKPSAHIWGLQRYDELCVALTAPSNTSVPLGNGGIGVYLDYEVGEVSFYAVGSRQRVFTFPVGSFSGERVFPYFCVLLSTIRLSAKGSTTAGVGL